MTLTRTPASLPARTIFMPARTGRFTATIATVGTGRKIPAMAGKRPSAPAALPRLLLRYSASRKLAPRERSVRKTSIQCVARQATVPRQCVWVEAEGDEGGVRLLLGSSRCGPSFGRLEDFDAFGRDAARTTCATTAAGDGIVLTRSYPHPSAAGAWDKVGTGRIERQTSPRLEHRLPHTFFFASGKLGEG